jgi:hypothetical protein
MDREFFNIREMLQLNGYEEVAESDDYIYAVKAYLKDMPCTYTIFDWLRDTKMNYPETLKSEYIDNI